MKVVRGKALDELDAAALATLAARYALVTMDIGTGDGRFAYRYALANEDRLVIGVDAVRENLREMSAKAARKQERGGAPNLIYVVASVERLPAELHGIADEVFVTLPWGSLMRGIAIGDELVLSGLASVGRPAATVRIVLNTRIFDDPVPIEARDLPEVTPDYVRDTLAPGYARHGIAISTARWMDADEVAALGTSWGKRLSHRAPPRSVLIEAVIERRYGET